MLFSLVRYGMIVIRCQFIESKSNKINTDTDIDDVQSVSVRFDTIVAPAAKHVRISLVNIIKSLMNI
ncbi:hypothetical protein HanRHA438_Chr12g0570581 [Helianthus annuus]|uniref:Uncharacterized protein n=1 Tax=Helianthus annuus TaxID=4232 RepID=A0A251TG62_HELAN|nr:hypothetical protein HanXRQr2_Chr12g0559291 [Helianthus annuus]KAJ0494978.1 hypothetical protein HanIR_Chr12g0603651 [Helianthus annuus]KAJ0868084.1 hypothetical protein HanRHA438_Chr12g0570581 [Helianthus annuus]